MTEHKLQTPRHGRFQSLETLLAFNRNLKHQQAIAAAKHVGGYESAIEIFCQKEVETESGWRTVEKYFFDRLNVLTVLDRNGSCGVIEVSQVAAQWQVDIGYPSRHTWWHFDSLEEAINFASEKADRINSANDPVSELTAILQWRAD